MIRADVFQKEEYTRKHKDPSKKIDGSNAKVDRIFDTLRAKNLLPVRSGYSHYDGTDFEPAQHIAPVVPVPFYVGIDDLLFDTPDSRNADQKVIHHSQLGTDYHEAHSSIFGLARYIAPRENYKSMEAYTAISERESNRDYTPAEIRQIMREQEQEKQSIEHAKRLARDRNMREELHLGVEMPPEAASEWIKLH